MVAEKEEQEHQETGDRKFFVRVYKIWFPWVFQWFYVCQWSSSRQCS
jgi:hypothetical protein